MKNEIALKVYEIDYSFIIKNYLDKSLWSKVWTLFVYKNYVFEIRLKSINTINNSIDFRISHNQYTASDWTNWYYTENTRTISHNLENSNINVLKKQINGAIRYLIEQIESAVIMKSDAYQELKDCIAEEKNTLRQIAIDFLDEEGVTNDEIRKAYIDKYVSDNVNTNRTGEYRREKTYTELPDLYLVFAEVVEDEDLKNRVLGKMNDDKADLLIKEVKEYMEQLKTEEMQEELKDNLESI